MQSTATAKSLPLYHCSHKAWTEARSTASDNNYLKSNSLLLDRGVNVEHLHHRSMEPQQRQSGRRRMNRQEMGEILLIYIFAQGSTKRFCRSPGAVLKESIDTPSNYKPKQIMSGQAALIKVSGAAIPMHGVSCLEHTALSHVPGAAKWKGLTCYLQSILASSVRPSSARVTRRGWAAAPRLSGGSGSMLPARVSGKGWQ